MSEEEIKETTSLAEQAESQTESKKENSADLKEKIESKLDINFDKKSRDNQLSKSFKEDIANLQTLLNSGFVNHQQGQNLLNHIIRKALDENVHNMMENKTETVFDKNAAFKEFENENPNFFTAEGRSEILNYLKSDEIQFDKDELSKIAKIVEQVEKSAIERYLKKAAHEENLEKANSQAKQRLQANAQKTKNDGKNNAPFTREQIGKMSSADFLKYEKEIMDQLKKGLIK